MIAVYTKYTKNILKVVMSFQSLNIFTNIII